MVLNVINFAIIFLYKAPLTRADTLTLAGSLKIKNGNGSGSASVSVRRTLSHRAWGEVGMIAAAEFLHHDL